MLPKIYLAKSLQKCKDKWNQETLKRQLSRSENRKWKWKKLGKLTFPKIIMFCKKNLGNILIDKSNNAEPIVTKNAEKAIFETTTKQSFY